MSDGFFSYLLRQVHRSDAVGLAARRAMQDSNTPIHPPSRMRAHFERVGASEEEMAGFDAAVDEWCDRLPA